MASPVESGFHGAVMVSRFFKIMAWLVMTSALISAIVLAHEDSSVGASGGVTFRDIITMLGVGVFVGASFGFFAYVLDLLLAIVRQGEPGGRLLWTSAGTPQSPSAQPSDVVTPLGPSTAATATNTLSRAAGVCPGCHQTVEFERDLIEGTKARRQPVDCPKCGRANWVGGWKWAT